MFVLFIYRSTINVSILKTNITHATEVSVEPKNLKKLILLKSIVL